MDFGVEKLIDPYWPNLTCTEVHERYPFLPICAPYPTPMNLKSFLPIMYFRTLSTKKISSRLDDDFVHDYYSSFRIPPPDGFALKNAVYADIEQEFAKYNEAEFFGISDQYIKLIYEILVNMFYPFTLNSYILDWDALTPLVEWNSSCGAVMRHIYKNKRDEFEHEGFTRAQKLWDNPVPSIGTVYPKQSVAKIEKIQQGKVRSFLITPLDYGLCIMRYCSMFNHKLNSFCGDHPIFVGQNIFGGGWHRWILERQKKGQSWYAIDLSQCDSRVHNQFMALERNLRFDSLAVNLQTSEHRERFWRLWSDQVYLHVWFDGILYRKCCGNASGWPNTIYTNSIYMYCLFVYCWIRYKQDSGEHIYPSRFDQELSLFVCGDDAVFHFLENSSRLLLYATELGAIVKLENTMPRPIQDNTFCSKNTRIYQYGDRALYIPWLVEKNLEASWYYGTKRSSVQLTFIRTCQLMVDAVWHPELFARMNHFLQWLMAKYPELQREVPDKWGLCWSNIKPVLKTRAQLLSMWLD